MSPLKVISLFVVLIILFIMLFVMFRQDKKTTVLEREAMSRRAFPWWYYVSLFIALAIVLGPFNNTIKSYGTIFMLATVLVGYNWMQRKK